LKKIKYHVLGVMSGTSLDGIDLAQNIFNLSENGTWNYKNKTATNIVGLGDWEVNKNKLPNGLDYLIKKVEKKGIKFGIWIEPEMVNPKSELLFIGSYNLFVNLRLFKMNYCYFYDIAKLIVHK
jgi:hypothetical protein